MEDAVEGQILREDKPAGYSGVGWRFLWFLFHLAAIYALVKFLTPWLAGWTAGKFLPLLQHPTSSGPFQFLFSHLFAFSFIPAFLSGLINGRFKHKEAQFVWLVPALILAYKFVTFSAASVFGSQLSAAFHQYFEGGFLLYGDSRASVDVQWMVANSTELLRGYAQMQFTAPFYAGVGYSIAARISHQTDLNRKLAQTVTSWVGKSKLRRFAALLVFWIIFDRLFGYISQSILRWPSHSWTQTVFYGLGMALWFTVLSVFGWQREIDI